MPDETGHQQRTRTALPPRPKTTPNARYSRGALQKRLLPTRTLQPSPVAGRATVGRSVAQSMNGRSRRDRGPTTYGSHCTTPRSWSSTRHSNSRPLEKRSRHHPWPAGSKICRSRLTARQAPAPRAWQRPARPRSSAVRACRPCVAVPLKFRQLEFRLLEFRLLEFRLLEFRL
jgi:hypothetical protein